MRGRGRGRQGAFRNQPYNPGTGEDFIHRKKRKKKRPAGRGRQPVPARFGQKKPPPDVQYRHDISAREAARRLDADLAASRSRYNNNAPFAPETEDDIARRASYSLKDVPRRTGAQARESFYDHRQAHIDSLGDRLNKVKPNARPQPQPEFAQYGYEPVNQEKWKKR